MKNSKNFSIKIVSTMIVVIVCTVCLLMSSSLALTEKSAITTFEKSRYNIREDFAGEIGFLFTPKADISINSVSLPYFKENIKTKLFIYKAKVKSSQDTMTLPKEVELVQTVPFSFAGKTPNSKGYVSVKLSKPFALTKDTEYYMTYVTGKFDEFDCMKFYNSGMNATTIPILTSEEVRILSATFVLNVDNTEKFNLVREGANLLLDRSKPQVAFGIPDFTYTVNSSQISKPASIQASSSSTASKADSIVSSSATTSSEVDISVDEVEISMDSVASSQESVPVVTSQPDKSDDSNNSNLIVIFGLIIVAILTAGMIVIIFIVKRKFK
jgi:hypothetical protein